MKDRKKVYNLIYNFKTKHKEGFVKDEIEVLLQEFPNINLDKFYDALRGITVIKVKTEMIFFRDDIEKALNCSLENRNLKSWEWD